MKSTIKPIYDNPAVKLRGCTECRRGPFRDFIYSLSTNLKVGAFLFSLYNGFEQAEKFLFLSYDKQ